MPDTVFLRRSKIKVDSRLLGELPPTSCLVHTCCCGERCRSGHRASWSGCTNMRSWTPRVRRCLLYDRSGARLCCVRLLHHRLITPHVTAHFCACRDRWSQAHLLKCSKARSTEFISGEDQKQSRKSGAVEFVLARLLTDTLASLTQSFERGALASGEVRADVRTYTDSSSWRRPSLLKFRWSVGRCSRRLLRVVSIGRSGPVPCHGSANQGGTSMPRLRYC